MFVNRLALVVVFGMQLAVRAGDGLCRFIGFKPQVARLVLFGFAFLPQARVAKHQIVVRLQIFGIDGQRFFEFGNGVGVAFFKEEHAAKFVVDDAVARELLNDNPEVCDGAVVVAVFTEGFRIEEIRARQLCAGKILGYQRKAGAHECLHGGLSHRRNSCAPALR